MKQFVWFIILLTLFVTTVEASTSATIYKQRSVEYAVANSPKKALENIKEAVKLEPNNMAYLRAQGELANWVGDSKLAIESYQKVLEVEKDDSLLLKIALNHSWLGNLDEAVKYFDKYLDRYQNDKSAYIGYAKNEIWRGNYSQAEKLLDTYEAKFSADDTLLKTRVDLYTRVNWPIYANTLNGPLLEKFSEDYDLNYFKSLGEHYNHQPSEALASYKKVKNLRPDSKDTKDLKKFISKDIRSSVSIDGLYFTDNDDIDHYIYGVTGKYFISPETSVWLRYSYDRLTTKVTSPFVSIDGAPSSKAEHIGAGFSHIVSPSFHFDLEAGYTEVKRYNEETAYIKANGYIDVNDQHTLQIFGHHDFYPISPRSLSLGIEETKVGVLHTYTPDFEYTIVTQLAYSDFNDDNTKWEVIFAPRKAVLRTQKYKVDLGVRAWLYGFDEDPGNGYYAPELFESYMGTLFFTYKASQENEFTLMGSAGVLRDDSMSGFEFGYSIDALWTIGIYTDWSLAIKAGLANNERSYNPEYKASYIGAVIKYHF